MTLRLLAKPLVAATLLLNTLGCSKKEPAPQMNTGSYKISGQLKNCQVAASLRSLAGQDHLTVKFTTTPQPASGSELLNIEFIKPTGQPDSAFKFLWIGLYTDNRLTNIFPDAVATMTIMGKGVSGTFSAAGYNPIYAAYFADLQEGVFTNVQF
jgi:hypothetical protein